MANRRVAEAITMNEWLQSKWRKSVGVQRSKEETACRIIA
jgi:hypothetical protein